jgi:hypothetical protein
MTTPQQHKKTGMLFREESNPAIDPTSRRQQAKN